MLRMRVHTTPSLPQLKGIPKQRGARRLFERLGRFSKKGVRCGAGKGEDEYVLRLNAFFLDARGGNIYFVPDTKSSNSLRTELFGEA
jgi:hypothetical protein